MHVKRIMAAMIAVTLMLGLGWGTTFADKIEALYGVDPVDSSVLGSLNGKNYAAGDVVTMPIRAEAISISYASPTNTPLDNLSGLQLNAQANTGSEALGRLFQNVILQENTGSNKAAYPVLLTMQVGKLNRGADTPFSYTMRLEFGGTVTNTFQFHGTIVADTATPYTVNGFATGMPSLSTFSMTAGRTDVYERMKTSIFTYAGNSGIKPDYVTPADVAAYRLAVQTDNRYFTAKLVSSGSYVDLHLTASASAPVGTHDVLVTVYSSNSALSSGAVVLNSRVTISSNTVTDNEITGIDPGARLGYTANGIWGQTALNGAALSGFSSLENLSVRAGDELTLQFGSDFFLWEKGKPIPEVYALTSANLKKISVRNTGSLSGNYVDSVTLRYATSASGTSYVRIKFADKYVGSAEKRFSFTVALTYNGVQQAGTEVKIAGTITNDTIQLYSGDQYVDLSGGAVAEAMENIRNIEANLGEGVSILTHMTKGKLYYGSVDTSRDSRDDSNMRRYSDIDSVYNLTTSGFGTSGNTVKIDAGGTYHVYDGSLKYLGTTSSRLPYSRKYYLSTRRLRIESERDSSSSRRDSSSSRRDTGSSRSSSSASGGSSSSGQDKADGWEVLPERGATPGNVAGGNNNINPATGR